jgi:hypothetical protein
VTPALIDRLVADWVGHCWRAAGGAVLLPAAPVHDAVLID